MFISSLKYTSINQRSFLFGLLFLGLALSSCKKDGTDSSMDMSPENNREVIWQEIAKISESSKFSKIDTSLVNLNIDNGKITIQKLRETFTQLESGVPITETEYNEETYVAGSSNAFCNYNFTFTFWNLKSRGYPSIYTVSWSNGGSSSGWHHLSYDGFDPIADYTFTSTSVSGNCTDASGYGTWMRRFLGFTGIGLFRLL